MTRVAAFDCGTNSLRLLVADLDPATRHATELVREMRIVRLGEGVDRTGRLSKAALERVFATVEEYAALVAGQDVERMRFCATSAARDASNADEFVAGVRERLGIEPEVLDGDAEARASYLGATRSLPADLPAPWLVVDIGGGSTELVLGDADGRVEAAVSLDIGSVRLAERHFRDDPATAAEIAAVRVDVDAALDSSPVDVGQAGTMIGVAGTVTTIAAGALGLPAYDREVVHHSAITAGAVDGLVERLLRMTVEERKALPYMHPGRADVIGAGGVILDRIVARAGLGDLLVSEQDILDGIAWTLV